MLLSDRFISLRAESVRKIPKLCNVLTTTWKKQTATALSTDEWKGKKVVIVSVPGAFTVRVFRLLTQRSR